MTFGTRIDSPLGDIVLRIEDDFLTGLFFVGQKYFPSTMPIDDGTRRESSLARRARDELAGYFGGARATFSLPLRLRGTAFQRRVWDELMRVPFGECATYGELATRLGLASGAARAVGGAVGHNPVSIVVPCHRIVGATGSLTGYAGGLERKTALLALEARQPSLFGETLSLFD